MNDPIILTDKDGNEIPTCEKCGSLIVDVLGCACGKYKPIKHRRASGALGSPKKGY